jgi:hypothetical protein
VAKKTLIQLVDDLDGLPIADGEGRTVTLAMDGVTYDIDLSTGHVDALRETLAPYFAAGRKTAGRKGSNRPSAGKSDPAELQRIREWAAENGHAVSSRGRISATVRDAYDAAH